LAQARSESFSSLLKVSLQIQTPDYSSGKMFRAIKTWALLSLSAAFIGSSAVDDADTCVGESCSAGSVMLQSSKLGKKKSISAEEDGASRKAKVENLVMNGITVYNYHRRHEVRQLLGAERAGLRPSKANSLLEAGADDSVNWVVVLPKDYTAAQMQLMRDNLERLDNVECVHQGQTGTQTVSEIIVQATEAQLKQILEMYPEDIEEAEPEMAGAPIHDADEGDDELPSLLQNKKAAIPWGVDSIDGGRDQLNGAFGKQGEGVHVYVTDTGCRTSHEEFGGRAIPTLESISKTVNVCDPSDTSCAMDTRNHGTHVAGTITSTSYGVAPKATVHAVKIINDEGTTTTAWTLKAMDWIVQNAQRPAIMSMSIGFAGNSAAITNGIDAAVDAGITVVVAAGNENDDTCYNSPGSAENAITANAYDTDMTRASFSNYGPCTDIYAPGVAIKSTSSKSDTATTKMSGTSMSTPHVSAAAALILAENIDYTPDQVLAVLLQQSKESLVVNNMPKTVNKVLTLPTSNPTLTADPAKTPAPTPAPGAATAPGSAAVSKYFNVVGGDCMIAGAGGACIESPNYPDKYVTKDDCEIDTLGDTTVESISFNTEKSYDKLKINGVKFSGKTGPSAGDNIKGRITWSADRSTNKGGWKICATGSTEEERAPIANADPVAVPAALVRRQGAKCNDQCGTSGFCDYCGAGNACCKQDDPAAAAECAGMIGYSAKGASRFECVANPVLPAEAVKNSGKFCLTSCNSKTGYCDDFCGKGNACCRWGYTSQAIECKWMIGYTNFEKKFECVGPDQ